MGQKLYILIMGFLLTGCGLQSGTGSLTNPPDLPNIGEAPELSSEI